MAHTAFDGKKFQNHQEGKHYDEVKAPKQKAPKVMDPAEEGMGEQPIEESVAEHGPVHKMEMHAHHEDGHVHKSEHHDAMSAHEHVDKAMPQDDGAENEPMGEEMPMAAPGMKV